jgi:hypothetical protein
MLRNVDASIDSLLAVMSCERNTFDYTCLYALLAYGFNC